MLEKYFVRPVVTLLLRLLYRVEVRGLEHYRAAGDKVLIIANHVSYLDPLLIGAFLPEKPSFAINIYQAKKWYFSWLRWFIRLYELDPGKPLSMKSLIQDLRKGAKVVLFPEGRISTSGGIMKVYDGASLLVEKTGAAVLPIWVEGAQYSHMSRMRGKLRLRWFPKIRLTILPAKQFAEGEVASSRDIYDIMTHSAFAATPLRHSILDSLLEAVSRHGGGKHVALDGVTRDTLTYRQLLTKSFALSGALGPMLEGQRHVGMLLPTANGAMVVFTALHMLQKIPCMLNFSAGEANALHACRIAEVKTVLTSRAFVEKGKLEDIITALQREHTVLFLEDLRPKITAGAKLAALSKAFAPRKHLLEAMKNQHTHMPALVLYTSGSEGTPKGVVLSHSNVLSNVAQFSAILDLHSTDVLFNALPVFHSFGLVVGMITPMLLGIRAVMYPSPLHYRIIPELVYDSDATIMLGTDTFYNGYARYAHPYDFWRVRLAVSGAEKVREPTRKLFMERFRVPITEGYGVTETSPVLAVNTPLYGKSGTVGRLLPGIASRLESVEGLEKGGRLLVRGPNVMLGYLKADKPGVIQPQDDWYDTGDIVDIDEEGFITILGRAKRFAKIGGEMVSLAAVEDLAIALKPEAGHAAMAVADERKGEQVVLYTESKELTREELMHYARHKGVPELMLPRHVYFTEALPRLGNGKIDYVALGKQVKQGQA